MRGPALSLCEQHSLTELRSIQEGSLLWSMAAGNCQEPLTLTAWSHYHQGSCTFQFMIPV